MEHVSALWHQNSSRSPIWIVEQWDSLAQSTQHHWRVVLAQQDGHVLVSLPPHGEAQQCWGLLLPPERKCWYLDSPSSEWPRDAIDGHQKRDVLEVPSTAPVGPAVPGRLWVALNSDPNSHFLLVVLA